MTATILNLWAVHISEGVLAPPWWAGGMLLMIVLACIGAWRIRDEEIPRIALLTAVFFVASLLQLPVPPTHAHLLLNGLMGVLLGWRAALAIPLGVFLQTVLFQQGNLSTIGINSCLMTIPAIAASYLFCWLRRVPWVRQPWFRSTLVGLSVLVWVLSLTLSITMLLTGDWQHAVFEIALQPATLASAVVLASIAAWFERRLDHAPDFPIGLLIGELAVLGSVALNCLVLLQGGEQDWTYPALLEVLLHLPIAVIEGLVLGFTVGYLARVKPEMLGQESGDRNQESRIRSQKSGDAGQEAGIQRPVTAKSVAIGIVLVLLGCPGEAWAHRLEGEYKILPGRKIRVESWFDLTGDSPQGARVRALGPGGQVLADGKLDDKGFFVFDFSKAETLRVVISAGAGHRKEMVIKDSELMPFLSQSGNTDPPGKASPAAESTQLGPPTSERRGSVGLQDVLVGVGFILALAAFVIGWRNSQALRKLHLSMLQANKEPRTK